MLFAATWAAASASAAAPVPSSQELAVLHGAHEAFSKPDRRSQALQLVSSRGPITSERTVLPVVGHVTTGGVEWLQVMLPGRPNGHTGWIEKSATAPAVTTWHIVVNTPQRRVTVYEQGHVVRTFRAVVGKPSTPTPNGEFYVEEAIQLGPNDPGAPFALALSARSNVLQEFDGRPGQIALHGLANVGGVLGSAVSHGCVRLENSAMSWLVLRIGPGVPVSITG